MTAQRHVPSASIDATPKFIWIQTFSGFRTGRADYKGVSEILDLDVSDALLGTTIRRALAASRWVVPRSDASLPPGVEIDPILFNPDLSAQREAEAVASLMKRYGFKTRKSLFKDMESCDVELKDGSLVFQPTHHEKLELWVRRKEFAARDVVVSSEDPSEVVGASLRLALSRCSSSFANH